AAYPVATSRAARRVSLGSRPVTTWRCPSMWISALRSSGAMTMTAVGRECPGRDARLIVPPKAWGTWTCSCTGDEESQPTMTTDRGLKGHQAVTMAHAWSRLHAMILTVALRTHIRVTTRIRTRIAILPHDFRRMPL